MQKEPIVAGVIIVGALGYAAFNLDGTAKPNARLPGGTEACTYRAGTKDQEMVEAGGEAGRQILQAILKLERKCEFVTLVLPDGTRQDMKLGVAGRKPGERPPSSTGHFGIEDEGDATSTE